MAFFLTLNSRNVTVKGNTPTRFVTRLPAPLQIDLNWEVALLDIRYPKAWWNIPDESYYIEVNNTKITLPPGFYNNAQTILDYFNSEMKKHLAQPPKLRYLECNNRIEAPSDTLQFSEPLYGVLGMGGQWEVDLNSAFHHLFLYTDVIHDGLVGDASAPLLRAIEVRDIDQYGDIVHLNYAHPLYMPLRRQRFDTLEILLADDLGRSIHFRGNESVLVTLHFRPHDF